MSSPPVSSSSSSPATVITTTTTVPVPSSSTPSSPPTTTNVAPTSPSTSAVVGDVRPGANTVFVGGVSWKADEENLREFFATKHGAVIDCKIITDRGTGKSKGYGFVTFSDVETAEAVKKSTDLFFLGKMMNVGDAYRKTEPTTMKRSPPTNSTPLTTEPTSPPPFIPAATNPGAMYQYYGYQPYPYYNMGHEQYQYGPYPVYPGYPVMYHEQQPVYPFPWPVPGEPMAPPPMTYAMPPVDDLALAVGQMSLEPCAPPIFRPTPVLATR